MNVPLPILRHLLLAFVVLALAAGAYWVAAHPSRPTSRLGPRGLKRQQALLHSPVWAAIEPLVRWTAARLSGILGAKVCRALDRQLTHAGDYLGMTGEEYFATMMLGGLFGGGAAGGLAFLSGVGFEILFTLVGAGAGAATPFLLVDGERAARLSAIARGLPSAIDLMALAMSAGLDFPGSVQQVVEKARANEALREELGYTLQNLHLGRTRTQALRELVERVPIEAVHELAQAIIQAEERGSPVVAVMEIQAQTARIRRTNQAEKAAADMNSKIVLPGMMLAAVGLMLIMIPASMMIEKLSAGSR